MLVRMLVGLSGNAYSLGPGDERDFPQDEALRLISAGFAAPVAEVKIERAVQVPAAERRGRKRNVVSGNSDGSGNG
ncbi:hypothetical protein [Mesorhizobium sp.]|uniref:hypothetical protein n=1 Tax=Mesorhizobium sp. TaxID=1871066 RepID=UPI0012132BE6|nr:hypothetical protein [Mesorhizobium sp.]TIN10390.1 MAG: hypothetical protein E5Y14_11040 [Mesorhizobium sp.]